MPGSSHGHQGVKEAFRQPRLPAAVTDHNERLTISSVTSQGLTKLLADHAPDCFRDNKFEDYFGRKIAIDASMHIYQFLVRRLCP